jgi:hypothetical protein
LFPLGAPAAHLWHTSCSFKLSPINVVLHLLKRDHALWDDAGCEAAIRFGDDRTLPSAAAAAGPAVPPHAVVSAEGSAKDERDGGGAAPFVPAAAFAGRKAGYKFQVGEQGLGYYADSAQRSGAMDSANAPGQVVLPSSTDDKENQKENQPSQPQPASTLSSLTR